MSPAHNSTGSIVLMYSGSALYNFWHSALVIPGTLTNRSLLISWVSFRVLPHPLVVSILPARKSPPCVEVGRQAGTALGPISTGFFKCKILKSYLAFVALYKGWFLYRHISWFVPSEPFCVKCSPTTTTPIAKQCAAVITCRGLIRVPPQLYRTRTCHGIEYGTASCPPTILGDGLTPHVKSRYRVGCYVIYRNEAIILQSSTFHKINLNYFYILSTIQKHQYNVVLPSLNEIASTGLDLDLYCNVLHPNNPKKMTQDIKVDDFIFENSFYCTDFTDETTVSIMSFWRKRVCQH